jgi:phenylpropionate dioxygenase-like ring-hydroxylating dioxygenase large terminal subunit
MVGHGRLWYEPAMERADVLDRLESLIEQHPPAHALAAPFYCDPDIYAVDVQTFHGRMWLFAGLAAEVREPGDWITYEVAGESVILVRGRDQVVRAFANVCRHRGSRICTARAGRSRTLVCPYHAWTYELDGRLRSARQMAEDFDGTDFGLSGLPARELGGLLFVCLAEDPPDFEPLARDAGPFLAPYALTDAKVAARRRYEVGANWKVIMENFRECYHCRPAHPEYCRVSIGAAATGAPQLEAESRRQQERQSAHWDAVGLGSPWVPFTDDTWHLVQRYAMREGFVSETLDGGPAGPLLGSIPDRQAGIFAVTTYPNFWLEASGDHAVTMRHTPLAADRTEVEIAWLVRGDAEEGVDYDADRLTAFWRTTAEQDWELCEWTQAGVASRHYVPGPYAPTEEETDDWVRWYLARLPRSVPA